MMRWMCLLWAAALLMGIGIVRLMRTAVTPQPEPTEIVGAACEEEQERKPPDVR